MCGTPPEGIGNWSAHLSDNKFVYNKNTTCEHYWNCQLLIKRMTNLPSGDYGWRHAGYRSRCNTPLLLRIACPRLPSTPWDRPRWIRFGAAQAKKYKINKVCQVPSVEAMILACRNVVSCSIQFRHRLLPTPTFLPVSTLTAPSGKLAGMTTISSMLPSSTVYVATTSRTDGRTRIWSSPDEKPQGRHRQFVR